MARLAVGLGVIWLLLLPRATHGQRCAEPHYRWSEKVDTALATRPATPALISEILTAWAPPSLTSNDACAPLGGREDSLVVVTGWVRGLRLHESDGDRLIDVTDPPTTPVTSCFNAELPSRP